jgi:uncharacterized SAM-binding protein YcdF (DUF218 family)
MGAPSAPARARTRRRWGLGLAGAAALVAAWAIGFVDFVAGLPRPAERPHETTDAIVVLTGGSGRLDEGLTLLKRGRARRLLVSGVFRGVDVDGLLQLARRDTEGLSARIDLGHEAGDTRGNARETAHWMAAQGFASLTLVTAAYHMPRSLFEFRHAMPGIELVAHPVFPANVRLDAWWRSPGTAGLLASEYSKLLVARARIAAAAILGGAAEVRT